MQQDSLSQRDFYSRESLCVSPCHPVCSWFCFPFSSQYFFGNISKRMQEVKSSLNNWTANKFHWQVCHRREMMKKRRSHTETTQRRVTFILIFEKRKQDARIDPSLSRSFISRWGHEKGVSRWWSPQIINPSFRVLRTFSWKTQLSTSHAHRSNGTNVTTIEYHGYNKSFMQKVGGKEGWQFILHSKEKEGQ